MKLLKGRWNSCSALRTNSHKWSLVLIGMITTPWISFMDLMIFMDLLHWLLIWRQISFKVKALRSELPDYLHDVLLPYVPIHTLRSSDMSLLTIPILKTESAIARFSCACTNFLWRIATVKILQHLSSVEDLFRCDMDIDWSEIEPRFLSRS